MPDVVPLHSWDCPHPEHPIWPPQPPVPWPPGSPGHDHCGCGGHCDGHCGNLNSITRCWRQIAELKEIIEQIIGEVGGPIKTGPIMGVVNGSLAKSGMVGEVITASVTGAFTAAAQNQAISAAVLTPGDWQVACTCRVLATQGSTDGFTGASFQLNPLPPSVAPIEASFYGKENAFDLLLSSPSSVVNVTTPTLMAFQLFTNQQIWEASATGDAGSFTFTIMARRMR